MSPLFLPAMLSLVKAMKIKFGSELKVGDKIVHNHENYIVTNVVISEVSCCGRFDWGDQMRIDVAHYFHNSVPDDVKKWSKESNKKKKLLSCFQKERPQDITYLLTYKYYPFIVLEN